MTIKLALLKSGEDVITDMTEMCVGEEENRRVIGYYFDRPCVVKMRNPQQQPQTDANTQKAGFEVSLFPWMPLSKEKDIPVNPDWVVTLVDPVDEVKDSYEEKVNGIEERRESGSLDNRDNTDSDS